MHHKCGAHDRGSGAGAIKYLTGLKDSQGRLRAGIEILRGNPELTAKLIDSLKTRCRYTSSVIAFEKNDDPTDEEIQEVVSDWERVSFAGLRKEQFTYCAVLHKEADGSKHIHFITPRVELESGKSLNIAPPGHEHFYAKWRNTWNHEKGWARPDDPARARLVQAGKKNYRVAEEFRQGLAQTKDPKTAITDYLSEKVAHGLINDRPEMLQALAELGEINRVSNDYISIRLSPDEKPIRLKGLLYGKDFSPDLIEQVGGAQADRAGGREKPDLRAAEIARVELERVVEKRADYNRKYYKRPEPKAGKRADKSNDIDKRQGHRVEYSAERPSNFDQRPAGRVENHSGETVGFDANTDRRIEQPNSGNDGNNQKAPRVVDVLASHLVSPGQPVDLRGGELLGAVDGGKNKQSSGENTIRSADEIGSVEPGILQQSIRAENLHVKEVKNTPIIGEFYNGLYQPSFGNYAARGHHQYAPGIRSLPTLPGQHLDAVWKRASVLLPALARRDLEQRPEVGPEPVRRPDSRPGPVGQAGINPLPPTKKEQLISAAKALYDRARNSINQLIDRANRTTANANSAIDRAVRNAVQAARIHHYNSLPASRAVGNSNQVIGECAIRSGITNSAVERVHKAAVGARQQLDEAIAKIVSERAAEARRLALIQRVKDRVKPAPPERGGYEIG
jgi:hypothetical protein